MSIERIILLSLGGFAVVFALAVSDFAALPFALVGLLFAVLVSRHL